MRTTRNYRFTVDKTDGYMVRMVGAPVGQRAFSQDAVLANAQAMAIGVFGHESWCGVDEVHILQSGVDESCGEYWVTVEGPIGAGREKDITIPEPFWSVMGACETTCFVSCCGLDAFEIDISRIRGWAGTERLSDLSLASRQIEELAHGLPSRPGEHSSRQLRFTGTAEQWKEMLGTWRDAINEALLSVDRGVESA